MKKIRIRILNDTSKELIVRRPPTSHKIKPQKMTLEFVDGDEILLKIWDNNIILISKDNIVVKKPPCFRKAKGRGKMIVCKKCKCIMDCIVNRDCRQYPICLMDVDWRPIHCVDCKQYEKDTDGKVYI